MANSYYTPVKTFLAQTLARGSDVVSEYLLVETGFDLVEAAIASLIADVSELQSGGEVGFGASIDIRYVLVASGTDTLTATPNNAPGASDALVNGLWYHLFTPNNNTGAVTLDIGTTDGAVAVEKYNSSGALTALEADDLDANFPRRIVYDAGESKWVIPEITPFVGGLTYSAISTSTALSTGTQYVDTATAPTAHTLPLLSSTSPGDVVQVICGADGVTGVKVINHHASDSSGDPLTVLFKKHDYVEFISTGTAWVKNKERFTGRIRLGLTADQTGISSETAIFAVGANVTVDEDSTLGYDNSTNFRYDHNASWPNCRMDISMRIRTNGVLAYPVINGADYVNCSNGDSGAEMNTHNFLEVPVAAGDYVSWEAIPAGTDTVYGRAGKDESYITATIKSWEL